jgi:hypothetical protein
MSKRAEELATKIGTMAIRMAFRGDMSYRVEAAALIDTELRKEREAYAHGNVERDMVIAENGHLRNLLREAERKGEEMRAALADAHSLCIRPGLRDSVRLREIEATTKRARATSAEGTEPVSNTYKLEACPECGVLPPFAHNPGCKIGEAYL